MVILGLGTNLGDRLHFLRQALHALENTAGLHVLQVSPVYQSDALLPQNAPSDWDNPYLNLALRCETSLSPYELLAITKKIEMDLGRLPGKDWGPRPIDIDILAWDELVQYDDKLHIPHEHLHERPFALWPLEDVAPFWVYPAPGPLFGKTATELAANWGSKLTGQAALNTRQIQQRIDTPKLMGIINVSPDSFSDGGRFLSVDHLVKHAQALVADGADVIDVGAEATGPGSVALSHHEEWQRLELILPELVQACARLSIPPKISVDTRHAKTAEKALELGVHLINDQSALGDPKMLDVIANSDCHYSFMHQLGLPTDKTVVMADNQDRLAIIYEWALQKLTLLNSKGITPNRILFDVGIGFGKTAQQSLELIQHIAYFKSLHVNLMVGHSRKSFLSLFTTHKAAERDLETLAVSTVLLNQPVDYLRIHTVKDTAKLFKVCRALR